MTEQKVHVFGIRHHGPGSARSVLHALERLQPDAVLIEGPPDANDVIPLVAHAGMQPPVALLVYVPDEPHKAALFPLAVFSPEWQALRYALEHDIPVEFMDLPMAHQFRLRDDAAERLLAEAESASGDDEPEVTITEPEESTLEEEAMLPHDPLGALAQAAGYSDGESWWEQMVEQRQDSSDIFDAVLEAMTALREAIEEPPDSLNPLREAHMRKVIRATLKAGHERIAVICGAWHAPALLEDTMPAATHDNDLLQGPKKSKVATTWIPWTYSRLSVMSGYGAGIWSPGWYQHLWETPDNVAITWLTRVARLLRAEDLDASTAQVIDAVRLSETLAALRGRSAPGLDEYNEAALTVFCFGNVLPLQLIRDRLIVGDRLGEVPDETPMVPLQRDLQAEQKRLRMKPEAGQSTLRLDLRKQSHLERSHLLNRLTILKIHWGRKEQVSNAGGTFHEVWQMQWQPELVIELIEQSVWGNTIYEAATRYARHVADEAEVLPVLTGLVNSVLLADLPQAVDHIVHRLQTIAALTDDVNQLMASLPPLADVLVYSNVRRTDAKMVSEVVDGIITRTCISLPGAVAALADDAAQILFGLMVEFHGAIRLLNDPDQQATWHGILAKIMEQGSAHDLIRGRCCRILQDVRVLDSSEVVRQMRLAVSTAAQPIEAAAWITGFVQGSGLVLIHDEALLAVIDEWLLSLSEEDFRGLLPLLRRTFATFSEPERKQIGTIIKGQSQTSRKSTAVETRLDTERADAILPVFAELLGIADHDGSI